VTMYRVVRGSAEFRDLDGKMLELVAGDVVTAGKDTIDLVSMAENTQILRLGLMSGMDNLRRWTPTQRDAVDGLAAEIITQREVRPLRRDGKQVGYLYG